MKMYTVKLLEGEGETAKWVVVWSGAAKSTIDARKKAAFELMKNRMITNPPYNN